MGKRILVPVDGSEQAHCACDFVLEEFPDATMILLHVINPGDAGYSAQSSIPSFSEEWYDRAKESARSLFDEIGDDARDADMPVTQEIEVGNPTHTIVEYADENDIDQIVMGSHGRSGVSRIILGSVAENVVRHSPVPVTVTR